jgi:hypothetical protein
MSIRAGTLKEIALRSDSIGDFGRHLRDWLHEIRRASSRTQAFAAIADEPPQLREKFPEGRIADAWLGAYAEHLADKIGASVPEWAFVSWRMSKEPLFDEGATPALREIALVNSPLPFKRRNIFTPSIDLPLRLRAGRPGKSAEEKRRNNAERQRRFRQARLDEVATLRKVVREQAKQLKALA